MLDLARLDRIELTPVPRVQQAMAAVIGLNYRLVGLRIEMEGLEHIPRDAPVIFAMNHTDRFNYLPFLQNLHARGGFRYSATWVKGKYYDNPVMAWGLTATNNLPVPSRGYLFTKDFQRTLGRVPTAAEYERLRAWKSAPEHADPPSPQEPDLVRLWQTPRKVLGMRFRPEATPYPRFMDDLFSEMMRRFVALNRQALFQKSLNILIFPQGTRSIRLSQGHIGLAQLAMHTRVPIIPVGCSGSDRVYPGDRPWARSGRVHYRIDAPMTWDGELEPFLVHEPFEPFSRDAEQRHRARFQALVDRVMMRINDLVDPPYRFGTGKESDGVQGVERFV